MRDPIVLPESQTVPAGASLWETALAGAGTRAGVPGPGGKPAVRLPTTARPPTRGPSRPAKKRNGGRNTVLVALLAVFGAAVVLLNSGGGATARTVHHTTVRQATHGTQPEGALGATSGTATPPSCIAQPSNPTPTPGSEERVSVTQAPPGSEVQFQVIYPGGVVTSVSAGTADSYGRAEGSFTVRSLAQGGPAQNVGITVGAGGTSCVSEFMLEP